MNPPPHDPSLPEAVILDLDGTAALLGDRGPFEWEKVGQDAPNEPIRRLTTWLPNNVKILFVSGRDEVCRAETEEWLAKHFSNLQEAVFMRPAGDNRQDAIVKRELFETHIRGKYNVLFVLDDRLSVCRMWHSIGLPLFRVGDPDADF